MLREAIKARKKWAQIVALALVFAVFTPESVKTQTPITFDRLQTLKFGKYAAGETTSGTVVMPSNSNNPIISGSLVDFGGTSRRGRIRINGDANATVVITLPSSITIEKGSSGNTMTVDNFTMNVSNVTNLSGQGKKTVRIGATLHIGTTQTKGNYNDNNSFTVDVDYL